MYNLSSAMGQRFAEIATEMTDRIRRLGPSGLRHDGEMVGNLATALVGDD